MNESLTNQIKDILHSNAFPHTTNTANTHYESPFNYY